MVPRVTFLGSWLEDSKKSGGQHMTYVGSRFKLFRVGRSSLAPRNQVIPIQDVSILQFAISSCPDNQLWLNLHPNCCHLIQQLCLILIFSDLTTTDVPHLTKHLNMAYFILIPCVFQWDYWQCEHWYTSGRLWMYTPIKRCDTFIEKHHDYHWWYWWSVFKLEDYHGLSH